MGQPVLQIGGDTTGAVAAIAKLEREMEALKNKIARTQEQAGRPQKFPLLEQQNKQQVDRWQAANTRAMTANQKIADAPAIMQTRGILAQVRAQQASKEAAAQHADELAKQPALMDSIATKVVGIGVAYKLVSSAVSGVIAKNEEFLNKLDRIGEIRADEELKLQIQGGFTPEAIQKQMPEIERAVRTTPSIGGKTPEEMYANSVSLQTQLASSNVAGVETGAPLEAVLKLKAATNRFGRGIGGEAADVRSLIQLLKGQGNLKPGGKDIERMGGAIAEVFEKSDLQFSDISSLAPHAGKMTSAGIAPMQQLATFATLTDIQGGDLAGTSFERMVTAMSTLKEGGAEGDALAKLKMTPKEMVLSKGGNQLIPTLMKFRERLQAVPEDERPELMHEIFGERGGRAAADLMAPGRLEQVTQWSEMADKQAGFQTKVRTFQESRLARDRSNIAATGFSQRRHDIEQGEYTWREHDNALAASHSRDLEGRSAGSRAFLNFGSLVEDTGNWVFGKSMGATPTEMGYESPQATKQTELAERQLQVLERIEAKSDRPRERNRNGNIENVGSN